MDESEKNHLPTPLELQQELPISESQESFIAKSRETIKQILNGEDPRLLLIVGPCSIHDPQSAIEYAQRLKNLAEEVSDSFFLIMRFYTEKSRTSLGWKGLLYDPDLDGTQKIVRGLTLTRKLLLALAELQIPAAAELLDPSCSLYYCQLLSWGCIGARTAESQPHRIMASGLSIPIGFKNGTSGKVDVAINGVLVASQPHKYIGLDEDGRLKVIQTKGNPDAHVVLRGSDAAPNYEAPSIEFTLESLKRANLPQKLIIDCSHGNSRRSHMHQIDVFQSIINQSLDGAAAIRGLIIESHLHSGNQSLLSKNLKYAVSVTDPCLDWPETEKLIRQGALQLARAKGEVCCS